MARKIAKWIGVKVYAESALGTDITISAITQAAPGVVTTSAAHGLANGNVVRFNIVGMTEINNRDYRVVNASGSTFQLEAVTGGGGIDTTDYGAFTSGVANKVTHNYPISTITEISPSGGDFDFIDITTIHDSEKVQVPGMAGALSYSITHQWILEDGTLLAMEAASRDQEVRGFKFVWPAGQTMFFPGYVGYTHAPGGQAKGLVTANMALTGFGRPTYYST